MVTPISKQPLCYDPGRKKFIYYEELISGIEEIIFPQSLKREDQKLLVEERLRSGPSFTVQAISGMPYTRDELVQAIDKEDDMGRMTIEAELSMLKDLLEKISKEINR